MDKEVEYVQITKEYLNSLEYDARVLRLLEAGGVDNWDWYGESLKELFDGEDEK